MTGGVVLAAAFTPILIVVKVLILLFILIYTIFAALVIRQIQLLNKTLATSISPLIRIIGGVHFLLALLALILALVIF